MKLDAADVVALIGVILIAIAAYLVWPPLALVVVGGAMIVMALLWVRLRK